MIRCVQYPCVAEGWKRVHKITSRLRDDVSLRAVALPSTSIAARTRDRSALASREKCPCFQFARLLRSRPSIVRGPVLGMAAPRQGLPVRLERAPHRGAAFALSNASKRARTRSIAFEIFTFF